MDKSIRILFWITVFGLIVKLLYLLFVPVIYNDPIMTLSQTASLVKGDFFESNFAHYYREEGTYTMGIAYFWFLYFKIFGFSILSFSAYQVLSVLLVIFGIHLNFKLTSLKGLILFSTAVFATYIHGPRAEVLGLFVLFLFIKSLFSIKSDFIRASLAGFIIAYSALIHPLCALMAGLIFVHFHLTYKKFLPFIYSGLAFVLSFVVMTGFKPQNYFLNFLNSNELGDHSYDYLLLPKFFALAPLALFLILHLVFKLKKIYHLLFLGFVILAISYFGRSYYYPYLIAIGAYLLYFVDDEIKFENLKYKMIFPILLMPGMVLLLFPVLQHIEHPDYARTIREINNTTAEILRNTDSTSTVWVTHQVSLPAMNYDNSRFFWKSTLLMSEEKVHLQPNDILLISNAKTFENWKSQISNENLIVEEVVPERHGLLRMNTTLSKRSEPIGLFKVKAVEQD